MNKIKLLVPALLCALTSMAQTDAKNDHIRALLQATGAAKMGVQMMSQMIQSYKSEFPKATDKFWDSFMKEVDADALAEKIVPLYAKYYTDEDILGLLAFYKSPLGQKLLEKMPQVMTDAYVVGQAWGKELSDKAIKKMKDEGIIENN